MSEATVDSKGRVVIPEEIRKRLKMGEGTRVRITLEGESGSVIVVKANVEPRKFVELTRGAIKKGSPVKISDPLRLKEIWGALD